MPPIMMSSVLEKRIQLLEDVYELQFKLVNPTEITFRAGQFVNIRVDDGNPKILFRSYSIMSPPYEKDRVRTCIKVVPGGRATTWLSTVNEGSPITLMGPLGIFKFNENADKKTIFVATGTGITPLICMLNDQLEKGNNKPFHLIWGFRFEKDIFYTELLEEITKKYPNFTYTVTLSRPEDSWTGSCGRVTEWIENNITEPLNTQVYICGVGDMVLDTAAICEKIGMPKEDIHFERYD